MIHWNRRQVKLTDDTKIEIKTRTQTARFAQEERTLSMSNWARPAAVIFDMDGLMLETETLYYRAWKETAIELGRPIRESLFAAMVGVRSQECDRMLLEQMGDDFPLAEFRRRREQRWLELAELDGIQLKPGLSDLLNLLDSCAIPKAVATSSARSEAEHSLSVSGLLARFPVVVTGDEVANSKPAPDIFLAAAAALGVDPARCIAFEDSNAGTIAASSAGMRTYMVPDIVQPSDEARACAADVLDSLHHALPLFDF